MASLLYVKIHYGPCKSVNDVIYRPRKLKGIKVALQKHGYRVDFEPVQWRDYCMIETCGHEVFRCSVQNLKFNTCVQRDPVAQRAVQAVLQGTECCIRAKSFLWSWELLEHRLFVNNKCLPQDYFVSTIDIEPLEDFKQTLNAKWFEKQSKQLETITEERSDNDDSSDDGKPQ